MVTEQQKDKALALLDKYKEEKTHQIRNNIEDDCGTQDYESGSPKGNCEGDGHYMCKQCRHYKN